MTAADHPCPEAGPACAADRQRQLADFETFYLEHVELVRRVMARLLGPHAGIEDAIQEAFIVAFRKRASYAGDAQPSTWLYSIAQRVALSARRQMRVRAWLGLDAAPEPTDLVTPDTVFEQRAAAAELYGLLDQLGEKKRTVWILHELEGLPGKTIAAIVGCPVETVWTRLYHARRDLQQIARAHAERSDP
jgi:RNA polymerase sigma-70 factor (ECF subfamily)